MWLELHLRMHHRSTSLLSNPAFLISLWIYVFRVLPNKVSTHVLGLLSMGCRYFTIGDVLVSVLNKNIELATECPVISCPCYTRKFCHAAPRIVLCKCVCVLVAQSCLTLCDPMDCSPPDSFVHGILQARILEWIAISFSTSRNHLLAQSS